MKGDRKISYEIFSKVVIKFQKSVTKISQVATVCQQKRMSAMTCAPT